MTDTFLKVGVLLLGVGLLVILARVIFIVLISLRMSSTQSPIPEQPSPLSDTVKELSPLDSTLKTHSPVDDSKEQQTSRQPAKSTPDVKKRNEVDDLKSDQRRGNFIDNQKGGTTNQFYFEKEVTIQNRTSPVPTVEITNRIINYLEENGVKSVAIHYELAGITQEYATRMMQLLLERKYEVTIYANVQSGFRPNSIWLRKSEQDSTWAYLSIGPLH